MPTTIRALRKDNAEDLYKRLTADDTEFGANSHADIVNLYIKRFQRLARRIYSLDLAQCNRLLTEEEQSEREGCLARANTYAEVFNLRAYHQSDVRGWTLVLVPNDGLEHDNDYDAVGIKVCPF